MTRAAIVRQVFLTAIVISTRAEGSLSFTTSENGFRTVTRRNLRERSQHSQYDFVQNINLDPTLVQFFKNEDPGNDNEGHRMSTLQNPVFHIKESIWKNDIVSNSKSTQSRAGNRTGGSLSKIHGRNLGQDDDDDEDDEDEDDEDERAEEHSWLDYHNYDKEEVDDHKEELITDDTDSGFIYEEVGAAVDSIDNDHDVDETSTSTSDPTSPETTFWDELDAMDRNDDPMPIEEPIADMNIDPNTIVVNIVLGVVNADTITNKDVNTIVRMASRTISKILKKDPGVPFYVKDHLYKVELRKETNSDWAGHVEDDFYPDPEADGGSEEYDGGSEEYDGVEDDHYQEIEKVSLGKLYLEQNVVVPLMHNWWQHSTIFSVWASYNSNKPVLNRDVLKKIEGICAHSIEKSIEEHTYWKTLESLRIGNQDLIISGSIYFADDVGLFDVKAVGDDYDMSNMYCPTNRVGEGESCAYLNNKELNATYQEVIAGSLSEIKWGTREWVGLGIMVSTIVFVFTLSLSAHIVAKKRKQQLLWGAALTSNGVDDILQVGWRVYEQQTEGQLPEFVTDEPKRPPAQKEPQLYLQIYDKGKGVGYNDENSLLKGGVQQRHLVENSEANVAVEDPASTPESPKT